MNFGIGLVITVGCILGGYAALGGHLEVLFQPYEFVIIAGSSLGIFIVANAMSTIKDCGKAFVEAVLDKAPKPRDFLDVLSALHALMRELRAKSRSEVEAHFDNPQESEIFKNFPKLLADKDLVTFICDYGRLIIIGNARPHEIEALMDEEIETLAHDRYKPVHAFQAVADGLPALGIVAAVLGIIHAMGALDQSPEILGGLIGAALVGTFAGIFLSYAILAPIAQKIKTVRQKQLRLFTLVKQSLLAFMNGAMPQVAVEFGRKTIPSKERPTIDVVENETTSAGRAAASPRSGRPHEHGRGNARARSWRAQAAGRDARASGLAIERMPGLAYALNRFIAEAPLRLASLIARPSGGAIEEVRATTLFQAIGDCSGLTAALYESVEPEARLMIALDERIDRLIVSSIFGEIVGPDSPDKAGKRPRRPRTAIEAALLEAFARALGEALEAAFAPLARVTLGSSGWPRSGIHSRSAGGTARRRRRGSRLG